MLYVIDSICSFYDYKIEAQSKYRKKIGKSITFLNFFVELRFIFDLLLLNDDFDSNRPINIPVNFKLLSI